MSPDLAKSMVRNLKAGCVIADAELKVRDWTKGAASYTAHTLGRNVNLTELFPFLAGRTQLLLDIINEKSETLVLPRLLNNHSNGPGEFFTFTALPHQFESGNEKGLICFLQDETSDIKREIAHLNRIDELQQNLADQNRELNELNQIKSSFLAIASHELRAPLASARSFLDLVVDGSFGPLTDQQQHFLRLALNNLGRMQNLTNDLLEAERLETGMLQIDRTDFELPSLARVVAESFAPELKRRNLQIEFEQSGEGEKGRYRVSADMGRIEQVLLNLYSNAIKYSQLEEGEITVTFRDVDGMIVTSIHDNGIGIDETEQDRLFQRFFRASNASSQGARGNGLGLSIVKAIIERHGGAIWVDSKLQEGSTFSFSLPRSESTAE